MDTLKTEAEIGRILFEQNKHHLAYNHLQNVLPKLAEKVGPENHEYLYYVRIMDIVKTTMFTTRVNDPDEIIQYLNDKFIQAVQRNDVNAVKSHLSHGADVNGKNADGFTPLHFAVRINSKEMLQFLLDNAADPIQSSTKGNTPLHTAASLGHTELAGILVDHVKENSRSNFYSFINGQTTNGKMTALHVAAKGSNVNLVKLLLKHGAIFDVVEAKGQKPADLSTNDEIKRLLKCCDDLFLSVKATV